MLEAVFTGIYERCGWHSRESVSGTGSELRATVNIRKQIPKVFHKYEIYKVLDIGCGDCNWIKEIWDHFDYYLGVDVVEGLIGKNQTLYEEEGRIEFRHGNVETIDFNRYKYFLYPRFDVVILSDVLVHLSYNRINTVLNHLKECKVKYVLITHFTGITKNRDIKDGDWRPLNMCVDPFNFPTPLEVILHNDEQVKIAQTKTLSLWQL